MKSRYYSLEEKFRNYSAIGSLGKPLNPAGLAISIPLMLTQSPQDGRVETQVFWHLIWGIEA